MDEELQEIFQLLKRFLASLGLLGGSKRRQQTTSTNILPAGGYRSPLRSSWTNLGGFAAGIYLNERHKHGHYGVDMQTSHGTAVYAFAPGKVLSAGSSPGNTMGGITVTLLHNNGLMTYYAHLSSVSVSKGEMVDANTQIGSVGNTGNAAGGPPHLHFEVHANIDPKNPTANWNGTAVDPAGYFNVPAYAKTEPAKRSNIG